MKQRFPADRAGVGQAIEHIRRVLQDRHIKNSEIERTVLTAEEAMGELFAHAKEGGSLHVVSHTFLGTTSFELSTDGEAFDFQESLASPMFISMCNCLGDVVITTVVAKSEKLIDVKKTGMKSYAILTL